MMKSFIVFNSEGVILRTGSCPDNMMVAQASGDDDWVMEGTANDAEQYVKGDKVVSKKVFPIVDTANVIANGISKVVFEGLPNPCTIDVTCPAFGISDTVQTSSGIFEFRSEFKANFTLNFSALHYKPKDVTIHAV